MHHHTGSSHIIYTMEELRIQGEELLIIKGFEKTYVRAGDDTKPFHASGYTYQATLTKLSVVREVGATQFFYVSLEVNLHNTNFL